LLISVVFVMKPRFINNLGFSDPYGSTSSRVDSLFSRSNSRPASNGMTVHRVGMDSPFFLKTMECLGKGECGTDSTSPDPLLDWVLTGNTDTNCKPLKDPPEKYRQEWFLWMAKVRGRVQLCVNRTFPTYSGPPPPRSNPFPRPTSTVVGSVLLAPDCTHS
jgi:hypothetical protein